MLENVKLNSVLFLDLETAAGWETWEAVPDIFKKLYEEKFVRFYADKGEDAKTHFEREAGLDASFNRIVCASLGRFITKDNDLKLEIASFADFDEKKVLSELHTFLGKMPEHVYLCAHNGTHFDLPVLSRRFLINGFSLPGCLDFAEKKPWERRIIDPLVIWRFGDGKSYIKLELLATLFGISSPKENLRGEDVSKTFWQDKDLKRISSYCSSDIKCLSNIFLKLKGKQVLSDENVIVKS